MKRAHRWTSWLKALAGLAVLAGMGLLLVRALYYPHTFRGRFECVRLGMSEGEAHVILGPRPAAPGGGPSGASLVETHVLQGEGVKVSVYEKEDAAAEEARLTIREIMRYARWGSRPPPQIRRVHYPAKTPRELEAFQTWSNADASIVLEFDESGRLVEKSWLDYSGRRSVWSRFRAWLGVL